MSKAKKPKIKCPGCEEYFYREDFPYVHLKNRYWHKECYEKTQAKEEKLEKDMSDLEDYICELFDTTFVAPRIQKQISSFTTRYNFTYSGILGSLKYWFEIKDGSIEKSNGGIGIVPYIYEDASKYFSSLAQVQTANKDVEKLSYKNKEIVIAPPRKKGRTLKAINLDFLEEECN